MYNSLLVVDDFYDKPDEVRKVALGCEYPSHEGPLTFPGRNSKQKFHPPGMDKVVSNLVSENLRASRAPGAYHGAFRITLAGEPSRYMVHVDPNFLTWVGVIYLSRAEDCTGGTTFYRHKEMGSDRSPLTQAELEEQGVADVAALLQRDGKDPERWECLMTVPMRYNRMVLYRPWLWHSAGEAFGDRVENGRLIQLLSFEPAGQAVQARPQGPQAAG